MSRKKTPATPSIQQLSPRLRLNSHNFKTVKNHHDNAYYEKQIMQEMLQRSCITQHPTSGYKTATKEIKRVYDGFEVYNYLDKVKPKEPEDEDNKKTWLQKLLSISLHARHSLTTSRSKTSIDYEKKDGKKQAQVQQHEQVLQKTKILELYIDEYHRATWTTLQTHDMATTTSTWKYNTPSTTSLTCTSTTTQKITARRQYSSQVRTTTSR
eukprot:4487493-Amphidinium_carterae.1